MNPREQGDLGERAAMNWLWSRGAVVTVPVGHSPDFDLMTCWDGKPVRVQVKTSTFSRHGRWEIQLATAGGNQSWNRIVKYFDCARCDFLFVLVADGRQWFIPSTAIAARHGIRLGGPKFAEFEVEPGPRIPTLVAA